MAKRIPADVEVTNHLSIFTFNLLTEAARGWVKDNVQQDATYFASQLVVEPRYARELAAGMQDDGLVLRVIWRVAVSVDGSKRHTDYRNIEAETAAEAERKALAMPRVRAVKWVAEPDPDRRRS